MEAVGPREALGMIQERTAGMPLVVPDLVEAVDQEGPEGLLEAAELVEPVVPDVQRLRMVA